MEEATTIARGLHITDVCSRYDAACKRILAEKIVLAWIMKYCLNEFQNCDINDIATKYIEEEPEPSYSSVMPDEQGSMIRGLNSEDTTVHEGTIHYDIVFKARIPDTQKHLIINVELQNKFHPGYPLVTRGIYYGGRLISSQYGREFVGSHYEQIQKVYSIWICLNPPQGVTNTITAFKQNMENVFGHAEVAESHYDLMTVIMLGIGDPKINNDHPLLRLLRVLFSDELSEAEKRAILENEYGIAMTRRKAVTELCNLSEGILEKGIIKGIVRGTANDIKKLMKNMNISMMQAMDILEIPKTERQEYQTLLHNSDIGDLDS